MMMLAVEDAWSGFVLALRFGPGMQERLVPTGGIYFDP